MNAAKDDEEFDDPKKNFASGFTCLKSCRLHLVFGKRSQSKSLVQVPE